MENLFAGAGKSAINVGQFVGGNLMGFNRSDQVARGVESELHARAFVFEQDGVLLAVVVAEIWSCTEAVRGTLLGIIARTPALNQLKPEHVMISGTHTHSGPAGISTYPLYSNMTGGYRQNVVDAIAGAMASALEIAIKAKRPAVLEHRHFDPAENTNSWYGNRSLGAYAANPESERKRYPGPRETAVDLLLIKDAASESNLIGSLSWVAIHGTALGPTNDRFSSDIHGFAANVVEQKMGKKPGQKSGEGGFVAGVINGCCGDISPNLRTVGNGIEQKVRRDGNFIEEAVGFVETAAESAWNLIKGIFSPNAGAGAVKKETDADTLTFVGRELGYVLLACHYDSNNASRIKVDGKITAAFETSDMTAWSGNGMRTWTGAIGLCTLAGATLDGPGPAFLREGIRDDDVSPAEGVILNAVRIISSKPASAGAGQFNIGTGIIQWLQKSFGVGSDSYVPGADYVAGHKPKPIAVMTSRIAPQDLPVQILLLGSLAIVGIPAEMTTMAGRRMKEQVEDAFSLARVFVPVLVTCYANGYSQYVTTPEEYGTQHYEGASTLFGPHTLDAYADRAHRLALVCLKRSTRQGSDSRSDLPA